MIVSNMYALPAVAFIRTYDPSITITAGNLTAWLRFEREKVATQPRPRVRLRVPHRWMAAGTWIRSDTLPFLTPCPTAVGARTESGMSDRIEGCAYTVTKVRHLHIYSTNSPRAQN